MKPAWLAGAVVLAGFLAVRRRKLEPTLLVGGVLATVGAVVYGLGLVELPDLEELLTDLGERLGTWTYLFVGVLAFLETGAFVGLLAPGETAIVVGGVVAGQGEISIVVLIAITWVAAVGGDVVSFLIGRRLGRDFLVKHGPKVSITEERLHTVEHFYERHGGKAVFLGRFVGLVRAVSPFVAASSGMPLKRFLPYDVLGAGLWSATFCLLGYLFWQSIGTVLDYAKTGTATLGSVIVAVVVVVWLRNRLRRHEQRQKVLAWMRARPGLRRLVTPTRFVWRRVTPGDLGLEITSMTALAAVGAFVLVALATELDGAELGPFDQRALDLSDDLRRTTLIDVGEALTVLGSAPVAGGVALLAAAVLLARREVVEAAALALGAAATYGLVHVVHAAEGRPRPPGRLVDVDGPGFPSAHASYAVAWVAVSVAIARALPGLTAKAALMVSATVLAALIGLTRVQLRAAWFTDVAAGWAAGALAFAVCGIAALFVGSLRHDGPRRG